MASTEFSGEWSRHALPTRMLRQHVSSSRIGPTDLTEGTVSGESGVPTITENLHAQGGISLNAVGVYFAPTTSKSTINGELTFGWYIRSG